MSDGFDLKNWKNWYFGSISRKYANSLLINEKPGVFLVRESNTFIGEYAISVKKDCKVDHYLICKVSDGKFTTENNEFPDLSSILFKLIYPNDIGIQTPLAVHTESWDNWLNNWM